MLTVNDLWSTPAGGWKVRDNDTRALIEGGIPNELWQRWIAHRRENELPALTFAEMQDVFCRQLPSDCPTCGEAFVNPHNYPDIAEWRKLENMPLSVWGERGWFTLHNHQLFDDPRENQRWMLAFTSSIPCNMAPRFCRQHFTEYISKHPPDYSSQENWFAWTWGAHQEVNRRTGNAGMALEEAKELYAH